MCKQNIGGKGAEPGVRNLNACREFWNSSVEICLRYCLGLTGRPLNKFQRIVQFLAGYCVFFFLIGQVRLKLFRARLRRLRAEFRCLCALIRLGYFKIKFFLCQ